MNILLFIQIISLLLKLIYEILELNTFLYLQYLFISGLYEEYSQSKIKLYSSHFLFSYF